MNLFRYIDFETISTCTRTCPTCIRNSHPDRESVKSRFTPVRLDESIIFDALRQCRELGFVGEICMSHYNEPLMDDRLPELCSIAKSFGRVFFNSNGDLLTPQMANDLDGNVDLIIFSLYDGGREDKYAWIKSLFKKTEITNNYSPHQTTHFSPKKDLANLIEINRGRNCIEPEIRVIISHSREYLLCCEDVVGNFGLGTFPEVSIRDYWYGEKHEEIHRVLLNDGGRVNYAYCSTCPRG